MSNSELDPEEIDQLEEYEGWQIAYDLSESRRDDRPQICFTGFPPSKKEYLSGIAMENGLKVVKSVTVNLEYLCCGENAGPSKLEKAGAQGVAIISEHEFLDTFMDGPTTVPTDLKVDQEQVDALMETVRKQSATIEALSKKLRARPFRAWPW